MTNQPLPPRVDLTKPTAWFVRRIMFVLIPISVVAFIIGVIGIIMGITPETGPRVLPFLFVGVIGAAAVRVAWTISTIRGKREAQAGYTTLNGEYRDYPQVDPRTGLVIRRAGAPLLSAAAAKVAIADVRARDEAAGEPRP